MNARKLLGATLALGAIVYGVGIASSSSAASTPVRIKTLSNRADLVSGGDVLAEIGSPRHPPVVVKLNGRDVSHAFARRGGNLRGRTVGLLDGLRRGVNVLEAHSGTTGARLRVTNYPNGGPVFAGYQVQPWVCQTEEAGFGRPRDKQCNIRPKYEFFYRSTNPTQSSFLPYDRKNPPSDVATTTTDQGHEVPYIVRQETGAMDRGWYAIAVLADPNEPWRAWSKQEGWNRKILWPFGGGNAVVHYQGSPPAVLNDSALSKGFMVAASSLNTAGQNNNYVVSAEAVMMLKERIIERYGEIRFVIGEGGSGGAIQQNIFSNVYPGLINGIQPSANFADGRSVASTAETRDCFLLTNYFNNKSPHLWAVESQRDAAAGHANNTTTCAALMALFGSLHDPTTGCGGDNTEPWRYDPESNPRGTRCTTEDFAVGLWGRRPRSVWTSVEKKIGRGFANRPWSNTGVQYGLVALQSGQILPEQFVDLNEKIGGYDIDNHFVDQRTEGDTAAFPIAYTSSQVNDARRMDQVPIIDLRGSSNYEWHSNLHSHAVRERLLRANGHADNFVVFWAPTPLVVPPNVSTESFDLMNRWLTAIEADKSTTPIEVKVVRHKPAGAVNSCYIGTVKVTDFSQCRLLLPYYGTPRIAAGGPLSNHYLKCQLKPLRLADYNVTFTDDQWTRLKAAFPKGVCDWRRAAVGERPSVAWMTFADGPGKGRPLGPRPSSRPIS